MTDQAPAPDDGLDPTDDAEPVAVPPYEEAPSSTGVVADPDADS